MANKLISKKNKMIKLKMAMEKLQRSLQLGRKLLPKNINELFDQYDEEAYVEDSSYVPEDVKEGHFAVVAVDDHNGVAKRFVVPLRYLTHPMFLAVLERAAEEYGFDHGGALNVPCRPSEMERILGSES